ncbi:hypothetical protein QW060_14825 [Myroides ceti]|uniref:Uncharacterized protein n=1 Tax=Paenimyroides ceti TaxID=395087 RepID=A0ABT8CV57_9FLAO|nr:hypothetical protein [Paenimyroides ceti]MDN3708373.1 hypothetical protein [Paenimyroides ceti]
MSPLFISGFFYACTKRPSKSEVEKIIPEPTFVSIVCSGNKCIML